MTEYITPLPGVLAFTLETAVNHVLQLDMESPERVKKLEGRLLQVDLEGVGITLFFTFKHGVVRVRLEAEGKPDTVISGYTGRLVLHGRARRSRLGFGGLKGNDQR